MASRGRVCPLIATLHKDADEAFFFGEQFLEVGYFLNYSSVAAASRYNGAYNCSACHSLYLLAPLMRLVAATLLKYTALKRVPANL